MPIGASVSIYRKVIAALLGLALQRGQQGKADTATRSHNHAVGPWSQSLYGDHDTSALIIAGSTLRMEPFGGKSICPLPELCLGVQTADPGIAMPASSLHGWLGPPL